MRWLLFVVGSLFAILALVGAFLPVLPTTPFLLVAGACYARSSQRFYEKLKHAPIFGAYLRQWDHDHSIPADAKRKAYVLVIATFGFSIWAIDSPSGRIALVATGLTLIVLLTRLPTTGEE